MLTAVNMPPGPIDIPSAWRGEDMAANPDRWLVRLSAGEIAELEAGGQIVPRDDAGTSAGSPKNNFRCRVSALTCRG